MSLDDEDSADLHLSIPLAGIVEEFSCPVCFTTMTECMMTPCGHNFCTECILECVNRRHKCPCCNAPAVKDQLIKNHHLDNLIGIVSREKEKASKMYFRKLLAGSGGRGDDDPSSTLGTKARGTAASRTQLSPIEEVFQRHMKASLASFEDYLQRLQRKRDKAIAMERERVADDSDVREECEEAILQLEEAYERSVECLAKHFDEHLSGTTAAPQFLHVSISVVCPGKDVRFDGVMVQPTDTLKDLQLAIQDRLAAIGNPLVGEDGWAKARFEVFGPLMAKGSKGCVVEDADVSLVLDVELDNGAEVHVLGEYILKSDEPKVCFTLTYAEGEVCDYYSCKDCKMNWICKNCAEECHRDHSVSPYIMGHKPTWACCYCAKKRGCCLPNNRSKRRKGKTRAK